MIRIFLSADLHYHPKFRRALQRLADQARHERPDCLILAGDIGYPLSAFRQGLALFAGLSCPKLALAGNHDLWTGEHDSRSLWDRRLEEAAHEAGFVWLDRDVVRLGSLGICGTLGWYEYSAREPSLILDEQDYYINKSMFNNDGSNIDWAATDLEFAAEVMQGFATRLAGLCYDPAITQIVVATHVPPFAENLTRKPDDFAWSVSNAYFGNLTLGQLIARCPRVTHVVSGHTHIGGQWLIPTPYGAVESYVIGSDYGKPAYIMLEFPWIVV